MSVTHTKVNNIANWTQAQLNTVIAGGAAPLPPAGTVLNDITLPSDWNAAHTVAIAIADLTATGTPSSSTFLRGDNQWATPAGGGSVTTTGSPVSGDMAKFSGATSITTAIAGTDYSAGTQGNATGIVKSTTGTGALTTAIAGDFPTLNQNTTGSAATLTTPRTINGTSFDGSANITVTAAAGTLTGATLAAGVTASSLTSVGAQAQALNMNTHLINNVTDPSGAQDAATKNYVDNAVLGQNFKEACKYASTAALPSIVYNNGSSGVGATLTGVALAAISLDSSSPSVNDRVLIKNQASTFQNGIYTVTATGSGIAVFVLTRATDANQSVEFKTGDSVFITAGSTLSTTTWAYTGTDSPTIGTDAITYAQVAGQGSFTAGTGITITGNSIALTVPVAVANGGTNATSASITAFNNITGYTASGATGTTSTNLVFSTSPTFITPTLGAATATSINKVAFTAPTTAATFAFGTDNTTQTFQGTDTIVGRATTDTLTNKRITKRVLSLSAGSATPAINTDSYDVVHITAQSAAITSFTTNLTGTPVDGDSLRISVTDDGTGRALTFGSSFEASTVALPTTTVASARLDIGFFWNTATSKWRCVAVA